MPAPDAGLFGPGSVTWRINREAAMLLGGGCALLLQLAHPLVAAGVAGHSDFRVDPMRRLRRTIDLTQALIYGTREEAERAAGQIRAVHARVRGVLPERVGAWPAGTSYDAEDPALLLWVHATLLEAAMRTYETFVRPFGLGERERYYEESRVGARLLGLPDGHIPPTLEDFARYWDRMLAGDEIAVSPAAHELARAVLFPRIRFVPRPAFAPLSIFTLGLLPEPVRERYGFGWGPARERTFRAWAALIRSLDPLVPSRVRLFPRARAAERRVGRRHR